MGALSRRSFALSAAPAFLRAQSRSRPNLLLLMADQHRADFTGYETSALHTPNLNRLAAEGVRFRHAYSSTPTCTPARAGLLTGCSPWRHGMLGYSQVAPSYPSEMPRVLASAGYYTYAIGKLHYHPQRNLHGFHGALLDESGRTLSPDFRSDYRTWFAMQAPHLDPDSTGIGWNDYKAGIYRLPEELHPTRWTGDCATRWLESYNRPEPFLLKVSFARPHSPYDPPARWMRHYDSKQLPERSVGAWATANQERNTPKDDLWRGDLGAETARESRRGYAASVSFVDEQIGRILDSLEKRRMLEETVIVYLSDHGDMLGDHHLWRKSYAYEASARIPMLWRGPGFGRGATDQRLAEIRDILPTFAHAAGAALPSQCDGMSLLAPAARPYLDLEHDVCYSPTNHWNALTDGRWKYIYHAQLGREQLFDLQSDPGERNDLSSGGPAELSFWRGRMAQHLSERGPAWVRDGALQPRPQSQLHSPNYPRA